MLDRLRRLYRRGSGPASWALRPLVAAGRAARRVAPHQQSPVWLCRGREVHSGLRLSFLYTGDAAQRAYLKKLAFGADAEEVYLGPRWLWQTRRVLLPGRSGGAALEITELPGPPGGTPSPNAFIVLPDWVWGEYVLDSVDPDGPVMQKRRRRVRNWKYGYEVSADRAVIDGFVRDMVIPYYERRYGDEALTFSSDDVPWDAGPIEALLVTQDGEAVAGTLIVYMEGGPVLWRVGVRDGDAELVRRGALQAVNYFRHQHLAQKGFARTQAGATKPFFNDGATAYKRTWGLRLTGSWHSDFALRVLRDDAAVRSFLANNPFVTWDDGKLAAAVFLPRDTPPCADELEALQRFLWPGIDHVVAYHFGDASSRDTGAQPSVVPAVVVRNVPMSG